MVVGSETQKSNKYYGKGTTNYISAYKRDKNKEI